MPGHSREYLATKFSPEVIRDAFLAFDALVAAPAGATPQPYRSNSIVTSNGDQWLHDSLDEFYGDYRRDITAAMIRSSHPYEQEMVLQFETTKIPGVTRIFVRLPKRSDVEQSSRSLRQRERRRRS